MATMHLNHPSPHRKLANRLLSNNGRGRAAGKQFSREVHLCGVSPSGTPGEFAARNDVGRLLVASSRTPLCDSCRVLLAEGIDPNAWIIMRHQGSDVDALRGKVGVAAKLTVKEPDRGHVHFARYVPISSSPVEPYTRKKAPALVQVPRAEAARLAEAQ